MANFALPINPLRFTNAASSISLSTQTPARSAQVLEQTVEFIQSVELVQTTVCAVISTVASLRCLFPVDCFKVHRYDTENPNCSYKTFMNTASEESANARRKVGHRYVPWDILFRGSNRGVNKLLDWLELGMADALSHKYLLTLQLGIYDGEVSLSKRIEAYVMAFTYAEDGVDMELQLLTARGLPLRPGKKISSAKQELRYLVHRLANHIGGFPELPPRSIVNMHFTYNDSCPSEYQPPGFVICQDHGHVLQKNEGALVGTVHPGPHRVDLRIFVQGQHEEVPNSLSPLAAETLRNTTDNMRPSKSTTVTEIVQAKGTGILNTLDPTQEYVQAQPMRTVEEVSGGQYRHLITAKIEKLARGETISPPCDRCRSLDAVCTKYSTVCTGCKKKHRKCSWNDVTDDEITGNVVSAADSGAASAVFSTLSTLNTQERAQLVAIDSMARLRSARNDPHDTQIFDSIVPGIDRRHGSIDVDGESTAVNGSSTQGTPSTLGGRHSTRLSALMPAVKTPPRDTIVMLRPRKRQPTLEKEERTPKLLKMSKARSPLTCSKHTS